MGFATLCLVFFMAEIAVKTIATSITQVNKATWLTLARSKEEKYVQENDQKDYGMKIN